MSDLEGLVTVLVLGLIGLGIAAIIAAEAFGIWKAVLQ